MLVMCHETPAVIAPHQSPALRGTAGASFPQGKPDPSTAFGGPPPLSGEAPLRRGRVREIGDGLRDPFANWPRNDRYRYASAFIRSKQQASFVIARTPVRGDVAIRYPRPSAAERVMGKSAFRQGNALFFDILTPAASAAGPWGPPGPGRGRRGARPYPRRPGIG